jgi:L-amino acid N-acyltransferase YncA
MARRYLVVEEQGITFFFKREPDHPELLHIHARHLTTIDDALDTYFDAVPTWNLRRQRFENRTATHGLYWVWLNEADRTVMIITCFGLGPGEASR